MGENNANIAHSTARTMLDTFASVGATHFNLTWRTSAGQLRRYDEHISTNDLVPALPVMLDEAIARNRNLIVRPENPGVTFIQLNDLDAGKLARIALAVFLSLETSPGNFQAWLALDGNEDKDFMRRIFHALRSAKHGRGI